MPLYRLSLRDPGYDKDGTPLESPLSVDFRGLAITATPIFVKTTDKLDIHRLYEKEGIAAKQYDTLPNHIKVVDLSGNRKITDIPL